MVVGVHTSARLASTYPHYATALGTTAEPTRIHAVATDDRGAEWLRVDFGEDATVSAVEIAATPAGHLAPLERTAASFAGLSSSLRMRITLTKMSSLFSVGVRNLVSHVAGFFDRPHVYGARLAMFTQHPEWDFPLALDRLVTTTLARPFADSGGRYEILVTDTAGAQTEFQQSYEHSMSRRVPFLRWLDRVSAHFNNRVLRLGDRRGESPTSRRSSARPARTCGAEACAGGRSAQPIGRTRTDATDPRRLRLAQPCFTSSAPGARRLCHAKDGNQLIVRDSHTSANNRYARHRLCRNQGVRHRLFHGLDRCGKERVDVHTSEPPKG